MESDSHGPARSDGRRTWRRPRVPWKVIVPTVAALGAGLGGAVAAGAIGSDPTVTGCYVTNPGESEVGSSGALRVIDQPGETGTDGTTCSTGLEGTITWNQQGMTGATGPTGATGAPGQPGQQGVAGPPGPAGGVSAGSGSGSNVDVTMELNPSNAKLGALGAVLPGASQQVAGQQIFTLDSFDLGATSTTSIGSATTGAGAGKATFQKFTVTKLVDKYSSDLFLDVTRGTSLKTVEITVRKPGVNGKSVPVAQYLMKLVAITDIHVTGGSRTPTETIQGEYGAIQFVIYEQMPDGTTKVGSAGGWNQVKNQPESTGVNGSLTSKRHRHR